jgi:hypothetical protein
LCRVNAIVASQGLLAVVYFGSIHRRENNLEFSLVRLAT